MFATTNHTADAAFPRHFASTIYTSDKLKIAYTKFTNTSEIPDDFVVFNMIFAHGNGMNKSVWRYYVDKLFAHGSTVGVAQGWAIKSMVTYDIVVHGDSAVLNKGKLGWGYKWDDGGRDINAVVRHEQATSGDFVQSPRRRNILVGHSMGGGQGFFAAIFEPCLYDSIIAIDPVSYTDTASMKHFQKLVPMLDKLYQDEFETREQCENYIRNGFMSKFHPEVLDYLVEDEVYVDSDGVYRTKASKAQQLAIYIGAAATLPYQMKLLPNITTPVTHISVSKGRFNPPATKQFVRNAIPKKYLTTADLQGEHLINGEDPDAVIEVIKKSLSDRSEIAKSNVSIYPEYSCGGNREEIFRANWERFAFRGGHLNEEKPKL